MSDYRRRFVPGGMVFLTAVTYDRRPLLTTEVVRRLLRESIQEVRIQWPFELFATVLLPDHWHLVMQLPEGTADYSTRMMRVKQSFTRSWRDLRLPEAEVTAAQHANGERGVWQPRFWEHMIRDAADLERCVDYIHWNPRKHGLVPRVQDYRWSSFHRFVGAGQYHVHWGGTAPDCIAADHDWGEPTT